MDLSRGCWKSAIRRTRARYARHVAVVGLAGLVLAAAAAEAAAAGEKASLFAEEVKPQTEDADDPLHYSRNSKPEFYGKDHPRVSYKGFVLIGTLDGKPGVPGNQEFFAKTKETIDMIERESPLFFALLRSINRSGKRVIYYRGRPGPASFNAWDDLYIVRIASTHIDDDPVFDNNPYQLAATLVHEMIGHGKQEADKRLWPMYDWCGKSHWDVHGVAMKPNRHGGSSGFVEYEAYLYAKWFLETVQREYPNFNEQIVRRYVKFIRFLQARFPGWYDDAKPPWVLLQAFEGRFGDICPGVNYSGHALALK